MQAFNAEWPQSTAAQGFFLNELLAIGAGVANFVEDAAGFVRELDHGVFAPPLPEASVIEIDEITNGEGHY